MNTFDDATHHSLDEKVNQAVSRLKLPQDLDHFQCLRLLCSIVVHSKNTLDENYKDVFVAAELFDSHPELVAMLKDAWKVKSYRAIRDSPLLQRKGARFDSGEESSTGFKRSMYKSFRAPYRGTAVRGFHQYLEKNNKAFGVVLGPTYYGKFCSIVQSSGTGKSRLMLELASEGVVVLYINLRSPADHSGFPPRDQIPADILTQNSEEDPVHYAARCCAFFAAVFTTIGTFLSKDLHTGVMAAKERWHTKMCDVLSTTRNEFFTELKTHYEDFAKIISKDEDLERAGDEMRKLSLDNATGKQRESSAPPMPGFLTMNEAYGQMLQALDPLFTDGNHHAPKLVIALDEAHTLNEPRQYRRSTILCRAISRFSGERRSENKPVWVVFASTTSKVADFAAPRPYFDSMRVSIDGQLLFSPYSQLGWDQNADPFGMIPATDVAKANHVIGYGRALWKSLQGTAMKGVDPILTMAKNKLAGPAGHSDNKALAVLGQRFCLNVAFGHREAVNFVEASVSSHMRVCITTTEDRHWSYTTYPSEPLLSCAAASLLYESQEAFSGTLKVLLDKVHDGMIDVGKSGELASRLLWLLAKDLIVHQTYPHGPILAVPKDGEVASKNKEPLKDDWNSEFIHCKMIPVHEYFKFLFGADFWSVAGDRAATDFENAYVNFSHWVSMDENIWKENRSDQLCADEWTLRHWHRTSAVQCCHDQPRVDKMIPIYFKPDAGNESSDAPYDLSNDLKRVSQIFISDKAGKNDSRRELQTITRRNESIKCNSSLPWVAIMADLGAQERESPLRLTASYPESNCKRLTADPNYDGPCLRIYAPKIDASTYPFLKQEQLQPLSSLLEAIILPRDIPGNQEPITELLQAQVQYGATPSKKHMKWEDWGKEIPGHNQ